MGFETGTRRLAWGIALVLTTLVALVLIPFSFREDAWDDEILAGYVSSQDEGWSDWFRRTTKGLTGEPLTQEEFFASSTSSTSAIRQLLTAELSGDLSADQTTMLEYFRERGLMPRLDQVFQAAHFDWGFFLTWTVFTGFAVSIVSHLTAAFSIWIWRGYRGV